MSSKESSFEKSDSSFLWKSGIPNKQNLRVNRIGNKDMEMSYQVMGKSHVTQGEIVDREEKRAQGQSPQHLEGK